jgi:hypothetical protein
MANVDFITGGGYTIPAFRPNLSRSGGPLTRTSIMVKSIWRFDSARV